MSVTLTLTPNQTPPAGDVVYPLRLLVAPADSRLDAPMWLCREAEAVRIRLDAGDTPETVLPGLLVPRMAALGYHPLPRAWTAIAHWQPAGVTLPPHPPSCRLDRAEEAVWMLSHPRADLPDDARVMLADGAVVAAAWTHGGEIAVETSPAYRRRGYARAVVGALLDDCMAAGREVRYRCVETNAASMALAAGLGLMLTTREYNPGFRRG